MSESHLEAEDLKYFRGIPWCCEILEDKAFQYAPTASRQEKASTEDSLFAEALKTANTISHCVSTYKKPTNPAQPIEEVRTLLSLGYQLNGYPEIAHGGVICFILDEMCGLLLTYNQELKQSPMRDPAVTASLQVSFFRALKTPQVVLATAKIKKIEGRKRVIEATIFNEQRIPIATGEAVFVALRESKGSKL